MSSHATRAQSGLCRRPIWVSLRACKLHLPCTMHTGCARPAGSSRLASGKPPPMARARALPSQSCDLIEVAAPKGFRLPLVSDAPGASCISADPRAPGRPWATAVALSSHTSPGSASLRHRCAVCTVADWARAWPATHAASCSAADSRRTASAGSGCIGSIMRAPSHAID